MGVGNRGARAGCLTLVLAVLLTAGCGGGGSDPADSSGSAPVLARKPAPYENGVPVPSDPWVLSTHRWESSYQGAYLGNGLVGQRYGLTGTGWSPTGADPSFRAGAYVQEALPALPPLTPLELRSDQRVFGADFSHLSEYRQELRLRTGELVTQTRWETGGGLARVELTAALLRNSPHLALLDVRVDNQSKLPLTARVPEAAFEGSPLERRGGEFTWQQMGTRIAGRITAFSPEAGPAGKSGEVTIPAGSAVRLVIATRAGAAGKSAPFPAALTASMVDRWLNEHRAAWQTLWQSDIEIEGDDSAREAQLVARVCRFNLLCSVAPNSDAGVPPMGLSAGTFNGHVFWDMDSWMVPALLPQHPELVRSMLAYRVRTLPGARANARGEKLPGASFAWESAGTGKETLTAEVFRHGRHVSGDVALAMGQYHAAVGDRRWWRESAEPVLRATADNWLARAKSSGKQLVVNGVTTPDELAGQVNHSAWTQHVARVNLHLADRAARDAGRAPNPAWKTSADRFGFLKNDQDLILAYEGFNDRTKAKQADALLVAFPGEADLPREKLGSMFDYYVHRVIANGPAMTDAIHAVVAARLGRGEEALKHLQGSYRPFLRSPYLVFSEKRSRDNVCFLTGAAGVLEGILYGFSGLKLDPLAEPTTKPVFRPNLPSGWKSIRLNGVRWRGSRYQVRITAAGAEVVPDPNRGGS